RHRVSPSRHPRVHSGSRLLRVDAGPRRDRVLHEPGGHPGHWLHGQPADHLGRLPGRVPRPPGAEGMSVTFTRRDASVAASAALLAIGVARIVGADTAVMGSRAVAWETLKAEPTKVGEVRHVFQAPTATLDELESHITTLNPGQVPHAPHTHPDEEVLCL